MRKQKQNRVPRSIQGEKSRKDTASLGKVVLTIGAWITLSRFTTKSVLRSEIL